MRHRIHLLFLLVGSVTSLALLSLAADEKGFMTGGGVGGVSCPEFLNAMSTARQKGGANRLPGVNEIDGFAMYVLGFQTGFNAEAEGVYDIFTSLGSDPALKALYAIEPWCASHPGSKIFRRCARSRDHATNREIEMVCGFIAAAAPAIEPRDPAIRPPHRQVCVITIAFPRKYQSSRFDRHSLIRGDGE